MLTGLSRRLRRDTRPEAGHVTEPAEPDRRAERPVESPGVEVEFRAYAEDCRVFGFYRLRGDRMTDALNDNAEYAVTDVLVVRNEDGLGTQLESLVLSRHELLAVRAAGPRGEPERRSRRRPFPVTLKTGPYVIHGYVHAVPGGDPLQQVRRRSPLVPLTESWMEYTAAGQAHRARVGTIIVNREQWDWIRLSKDDEVRLPDLPAEAAPDPRAKDMTGYIRSGIDG